MKTTLVSVVGVVFLSSAGWAQVLTPRSTAPAPVAPATAVAEPAPALVPLSVPAGTPLKVGLDKDVRIHHVGDEVHGKLLEPLFAFDRMVVPAGTEVLGSISAINRVSTKTRILSAMNADLSPYRAAHVEFHSLRLADGREVPLDADVSPASRGVLEFVPAAEPAGTFDKGKNLAAKKIQQARQQAKQEWDFAKRQLHEPGKVHRVERMGLAQLPYRPQYLDAGTAFNADLRQPLNFGAEAIEPEALMTIGSAPPTGTVVHAVLVTPLSSATSKAGDSVEAVITEPLIVEHRLYVPQGTRLQGTVLQARAARRFERNGQLRIVFHQLVPPSGIAQQIQASLEGVSVGRSENLALDSEGGAQVTTPKTRYLNTGIAVALAAASASPDHDRDLGRGNGGDAGGSVATGASGFKAVGMIAGALAHSRALGTGMGVYGASMSIYSHFLARGRDVVYPKDMSMLIGLGERDKSAEQTEPAATK